MLNYNSDSYNMSLLETAIGWVAPPTCLACGLEGRVVCEACQAAEITSFGPKCFACNRLSPEAKTCVSCRRRFPLQGVWIATEYEGLAKELILKFKFNHQRRAAGAIAEMMTDVLTEFNNDQNLTAKHFLIVPVPTASSRVRQRGFDHTGLLAQELKKKLHLESASALSRRGQLKQVGASRRIRSRQAEGSYVVRGNSNIKGRNILLIDDVVTTGATIGEAARVLRRGGAEKVYGLIFAKSL
jgi:ComF family protein